MRFINCYLSVLWTLKVGHPALNAVIFINAQCFRNMMASYITCIVKLNISSISEEHLANPWPSIGPTVYQLALCCPILCIKDVTVFLHVFVYSLILGFKELLHEIEEVEKKKIVLFICMGLYFTQFLLALSSGGCHFHS